MCACVCAYTCVVCACIHTHVLCVRAYIRMCCMCMCMCVCVSVRVCAWCVYKKFLCKFTFVFIICTYVCTLFRLHHMLTYAYFHLSSPFPTALANYASTCPTVCSAKESVPGSEGCAD